MIVQRLKVKIGSPYSLAERYYALLSVVNDLKLTQRDVQFLAFMATGEGISVERKDDFCKQYSTTLATVSNIMHKLKKKNMLVKEASKLVINSSIALDFTKDIEINIVFKHEGNN